MPKTRRTRMPTVGEVMTPMPTSVRPGDSLVRARSLMVKHDIRHLPVTDDDEVVGVVTDRDIHLVESVFTDPKERYALTVNDLTVSHTFIVDVEDPLDAVLTQMANRHIGSSIVVRGKKLAGIFTVTDACRHYGELLRSLYPSEREQA